MVVLEEHIYIYDISNMKLLHTIDTSPNAMGKRIVKLGSIKFLLLFSNSHLQYSLALCALSPSSDNCYLVYPSNASSALGELLIFDAVKLQAVNIIQAHKSPLSCLAFNYEGSMVATSSDKVFYLMRK